MIDDDLLRRGHVCIFCHHPWWNHILPGGKGCGESAWKVYNGTSKRPWLSRVTTAPKKVILEDQESWNMRMSEQIDELMDWLEEETSKADPLECPDCHGRGFVNWHGHIDRVGKTVLHKRCKTCSGEGDL